MLTITSAAWAKHYKSFPVQDDEHFFVVCRYVKRNALRAGLVGSAEDWRWGSLWRWLPSTEPEPKLLACWSIPRCPIWAVRVNEPRPPKEFAAGRLSAQRGRTFGDESWMETIAQQLQLESIMPPRGRSQVRPVLDKLNKEA